MQPRCHLVTLVVLLLLATTEGRTSHRARWELRSRTSSAKDGSRVHSQGNVVEVHESAGASNQRVWAPKLRAQTSDLKHHSDANENKTRTSNPSARDGIWRPGHVKLHAARKPGPHGRLDAVRQHKQHESASMKQHTRRVLDNSQSQNFMSPATEPGTAEPPAPTPSAMQCYKTLVCQPWEEWSNEECKCRAVAPGARSTRASPANSEPATSGPNSVPFEQVTPNKDFSNAAFAGIVSAIIAAAILLCVGAYLLYRKMRAILAEMDHLPDFAASAEMPSTDAKVKGRGYPKYLDSPPHYSTMNPIFNSPPDTDDDFTPDGKSPQGGETPTSSKSCSASFASEKDSSRMRSPRRQGMGPGGKWPGTTMDESHHVRLHVDHWATL